MEVIAESPDYLVINKPAGVLVHQANPNNKESTVADWMRERYPEVEEVGDDPKVRPGIVHRLDRDVSGLMVIARTNEFFAHIKAEFQNRRVVKRYTALCYGRIHKDEGDITLPLSRGKTRTSVKPFGDARGKEARTHFFVLKRFQHYTLVEITLHTGRTNQIRAHFYALEHSLAGDTKYRSWRFRNRSHFTRFIKSDRVFLHSHYLGFYDREGQWREYSSLLPSELKAFLDTLPEDLNG
ncbi:MAG: RNA pseudouridine synthase [Candidatus Jacksonbacteria bacterium]|nr:RNA pseudouridine synthase [Candidatus Jacksonbacteria bacterium]